MARRLEVLLTRGAERDLAQLYGFLAAAESSARADAVLARIVASISRLQTAPTRGSFPPELLALGIREYRQLVLRPWRIIYRVDGAFVHVYLIADSRRDLQALLARRLIEAE